jgi:hypothetical protein
MGVVDNSSARAHARMFVLPISLAIVSFDSAVLTKNFSPFLNASALQFDREMSAFLAI